MKCPLGLEEVVHQTRTMFHNLQLDHLHMAQKSPWYGNMENAQPGEALWILKEAWLVNHGLLNCLICILVP